MSPSYQKAYHKIKARKEEIRPKPIWGSWGKFYDNLFTLKDKLLLDFGSDIEAPLYQRFQSENSDGKGKYMGYDVGDDAVSWLKQNSYYYDFFKDDSRAGSFDLIVASQVYEHLTEVERESFLGRAHKLLSGSGLLIVDAPYIA